MFFGLQDFLMVEIQNWIESDSKQPRIVLEYYQSSDGIYDLRRPTNLLVNLALTNWSLILRVVSINKNSFQKNERIQRNRAE